MLLTFTVPGVPVPEGRKRVTTRGGKVHFYPNERTQNYRDRVAATVHEAMMRCQHADFPTSDPVAMRLVCFTPKPKNWLRSQVWPTNARSGDVDNLLKSVMDAMNGKVYVDDRQVVDVQVSKRFPVKGDEPRAIVTLWTAGTRRYEG